MATRKRRTKAQIKQLEAQIYEVCEADHPVSIRHCFYRMCNVRLPEPVEKTDNGYQQVQRLMSVMREAGRLPYQWIADATRRAIVTTGYASPEDFVRSVALAYRYDLWQNVQTRVEVWCESRSIAGMIEPECRRLAVPLYPCGGYSSKTFAFKAAQEYDEFAHVVFVGDYDPDGKRIGESLYRELQIHTDAQVTFERVAVNEEQIELYDLPTRPVKESTRSEPDMKVAVEAESMPVTTLRALVRGAVEHWLPPGAVEYARLMDEEGRRYLETFGF